MTSWSGFGRRREKGIPAPSPASLRALPDWLCVPGAQLQSLQTLSETQGSQSAATRGRRRAGRKSRGWRLWGPCGEGADGVGPRSLRGAQLAASPSLSSSPPPALSFPPSGGLPPPPPPHHPACPPATSPRFLIPATSALGGSFRGRRQPRGESLADAAGAACSRRRLVNGTRTRAGADTAALALCQGPTAGARAHPPGPQVRRAICAFFAPGWGFLGGGGSG